MKHNSEKQVYFFALTCAIWGMFWGSWGVLLPEIKNRLAVSEGMFSLSLTGIALGAIPAMLFTGMLIKKFTRITLFLTLAFFAMSIFLLIFVDSLPMLGLSLFLVGMSSGVVDIIINYGVSILESVTGKKYFNFVHSVFPIVAIVVSPITGFARQLQIDFRLIILTLSLIVLISGLLCLRLDNKVFDVNDMNQKSEKNKFSISKLIIYFGIIGLLIHVLENAVEQWSTLYLETQFTAQPNISSLGITAYMLMLFIGRILAQKLSNTVSEKFLIRGASLIFITGYLLVFSSSSVFLTILAYGITGLGIAPVIPLIFSRVSKSCTEKDRAKNISLITTIAYSGYLISPPFVGLMISVFNLKFAWLILSIVAIFTLVLIVFAMRYLDNERVGNVTG